jgi:hypothetical protein
MLATEFAELFSYSSLLDQKIFLISLDTLGVSPDLNRTTEDRRIAQNSHIFKFFVMFNTVLLLLCSLQVQLISDIIVLWVLTACCTVHDYQRFEGAGRSSGKMVPTYRNSRDSIYRREKALNILQISLFFKANRWYVSYSKKLFNWFN